MTIVFNNHKVDVSDVPCDSLNMLVQAMQNFIDGSDEEIVEWSLEPSYERWFFERKDGQSWFKIVDCNGVEVLLSTNGIGMVSAITEPLNKLKRGWKKDPGYIHWSWDFPGESLEKLSADIRNN